MSKDRQRATSEWSVSLRGAFDPAAPALIDGIADVYRASFSSANAAREWPVEAIRARLERAAAVAQLVDGSDRMRGYGVFERLRARVVGRPIVWESSIAVEPDSRRRRKSMELAERVRDVLVGGEPVWWAGRTQSPALVRRYRRMGPLFPFDFEYTMKPGPELLRALREEVPELLRSAPNALHGICRAAYREGVLGGFEPPDPQDPIEQQLVAWSFDRARGDAMVLVARYG